MGSYRRQRFREWAELTGEAVVGVLWFLVVILAELDWVLVMWKFLSEES